MFKNLSIRSCITSFSSWISMASSLNKGRNKIKFIKGIRGGICNALYWYAKANNKHMRDYDENKKSLYFKYWEVNHLYGWAMSQKFPVNKLNGQKAVLIWTTILQRIIMKKVMKDIFLKLMFSNQKNYINFMMTYHFTRKKENEKSLLLIYMIKINLQCHSNQKFKASIKLL